MVPGTGWSNTAYSRFVRNSADLEGAIAYALYKADKKDFIVHHDLAPEDPQVKNYHTRLGQETIQALRLRAKNLLSEYTSSVVVEAEERAQAKILDAIGSTQTLLKRRTSFWSAVMSSVVGTIAFALILTIAIWLNKNQQNPLGGLYQMMTEGTSPHTTASPPTPAASR